MPISLHHAPCIPIFQYPLNPFLLPPSTIHSMHSPIAYCQSSHVHEAPCVHGHPSLLPYPPHAHVSTVYHNPHLPYPLVSILHIHWIWTCSLIHSTTQAHYTPGCRSDYDFVPQGFCLLWFYSAWGSDACNRCTSLCDWTKVSEIIGWVSQVSEGGFFKFWGVPGLCCYSWYGVVK